MEGKNQCFACYIEVLRIYSWGIYPKCLIEPNFLSI